MDLRHLESFLVVAEELHFGRAAARLHISQPPLSTRIKELEYHLGVILFYRNSRYVSLTPQGAKLIPLARKVVQEIGIIEKVFQEVDLDDAERIRVGVPPDTKPCAIFDFVSKCRDEGIFVEIVERSTAEQVLGLSRSELLIGLLRLPVDTSRISVERVLSRKLGLVLHESNPLAGKNFIALSELSAMSLVLFRRSMQPGLYDEMLAQVRKAGWSPSTITHAERLSATLVTTSDAVLLREESFVSEFPGLVWKPIFGNAMYWQTAVVSHPTEDRRVLRCRTLLTNSLLALDDWNEA